VALSTAVSIFICVKIKAGPMVRVPILTVMNMVVIISFSAGIKASATDSALTDVLRIIEDYTTNGGVSAEELTFTQNSMTQSEARKYETGFQKAGFLNNILTYNLPADYTIKQNAISEKPYCRRMSTQLAKQRIYLPTIDW
jgi:Tfp pilus assembly protein PilE